MFASRSAEDAVIRTASNAVPQVAIGGQRRSKSRCLTTTAFRRAKSKGGVVTKANVRMQVEKIDGVSRTWFEWSVDPDDIQCGTLVVEVDFSTDPNEDSYRQNVIDAIEETTDEILADGLTTFCSRSADRSERPTKLIR
jgi:hypothetical protein